MKRRTAPEETVQPATQQRSEGRGVSLGVKQSAVILVAELYWREHGRAATWDEIRRAVDCPRFVLFSIMRRLERDGFVSFDESPRSLRVHPHAVRAAVESAHAGGEGEA